MGIAPYGARPAMSSRRVRRSDPPKNTARLRRIFRIRRQAGRMRNSPFDFPTSFKNILTFFNSFFTKHLTKSGSGCYNSLVYVWHKCFWVEKYPETLALRPWEPYETAVFGM